MTKASNYPKLKRKRLKILLVEDQVLDASFLVTLLKPLHSITHAFTFGLAVEALENGPYDLFIIDLGLHDMEGDGISLGEIINKKQPNNVKIIYSVWPNAMLESKLSKLGFLGGFSKFDLEMGANIKAWIDDFSRGTVRTDLFSFLLKPKMSLTLRERQVYFAHEQRFTRKHIMGLLNCSMQNVNKLLKNAHEKIRKALS